MQQSCRQCQAPFEITDDDLAFYDKVSPVFNGRKEQIPPPTLCPPCRSQRRMAWRNERSLYNRQCELCQTMKVSMFAPEAPYHTYCHDCLYSDKWDPLSYGRDYDFSLTFEENMRNLMRDVPMMMLFQTGINDNSDYINFAGSCRNCYLVFNTGRSEDCYYSRGILTSNDSLDLLICSDDEHCYECVNCTRSYNLRFSQNCTQCIDSAFLFNCRNCKHCFGCTNLTQKEYYLWNQPCSPEEYQQTMQQLGSASFAQECQQKLADLRLHSIHRASNNINTDDCTGDYISESKNCKECFEMTKSEDCKWLTCSRLCKDSYDLFGYGYDSELLYENAAVGNASKIAFSFATDYSQDAYRCLYCKNVDHCFGCISLLHKKYCILNKQYTKEEYEELVPKIIASMRSNNEWGEFPSVTLSPFSYNETIAQDYFPLSETEITQKGWRWKADIQAPLQVEKTIDASKLPDSIDDIPDDILNWAVTCAESGKPFRIIKQELDFYRRMRLPIPRFHFDVRHRHRMALCNPQTMYERQCDHCKKMIVTTYSPDRAEIVYCEQCYLETVY